MSRPKHTDRRRTIDIFSIERRPSAPGAWVSGTVDGYRFSALVFAGHALDPEYEVGQSRISKLWVQRLADRRTVYNWDRGLDVSAENDDVQAVVGLLLSDVPERADTALKWRD